jgi:hypothetical protein
MRWLAGGAIQVNGHRAVGAIIASVIMTGAGCSGTVAGRPAHRPADSAHRPADSAQRPAGSATSPRMGTCPPTLAAQRRESTPWPSRAILRESMVELIADQVVDPAARAVFLLVSETNTPARGPWVLCRISLGTGAVRLGPTFAGGGLAVASGRLWVYSTPGRGSRPAVSEVDPVTLQRVRPVPLPSVPASFGGVPATVTAGPAGSAWIGSYRTLLRLSVSTGTPLTKVTLPLGLAVSDVAEDPAGMTLYVSAAHVDPRGGIGGLVMLEYDARTGRMLAAASGGLIRDSVAGAALTAVPGGVWASFRTGMLGLTIHLGAKDLRIIAPPGPGVALTPATGVFHWPMYESTTYGGGILWVANQAGIVACLDPRTGAIRASEHLRQSQLIYQIESIDPTARMIFAFDNGDLLRITPPRRCWN